MRGCFNQLRLTNSILAVPSSSGCQLHLRLLQTAQADQSVCGCSAGMVGLAVTATLSLTGILNQLMRQLSDVEVQMNRSAFLYLTATAHLKQTQTSAFSQLHCQPVPLRPWTRATSPLPGNKSLTGILNQLMRQLSDVEVQMNRQVLYGHKMPHAQPSGVRPHALPASVLQIWLSPTQDTPIPWAWRSLR